MDTERVGDEAAVELGAGESEDARVEVLRAAVHVLDRAQHLLVVRHHVSACSGTDAVSLQEEKRCEQNQLSNTAAEPHFGTPFSTRCPTSELSL